VVKQKTHVVLGGSGEPIKNELSAVYKSPTFLKMQDSCYMFKNCCYLSLSTTLNFENQITQRYLSVHKCYFGRSLRNFDSVFVAILCSYLEILQIVRQYFQAKMVAQYHKKYNVLQLQPH